MDRPLEKDTWILGSPMLMDPHPSQQHADPLKTATVSNQVKGNV